MVVVRICTPGPVDPVGVGDREVLVQHGHAGSTTQAVEVRGRRPLGERPVCQAQWLGDEERDHGPEPGPLAALSHGLRFALRSFLRLQLRVVGLQVWYSPLTNGADE